MEMSKRILFSLIGVFVIGAAMVGASNYYSMYYAHKTAANDADFKAMHDAMINGDFDTAWQYHQATGFDCPMHEAVVSGEVSTDEFVTMQQWMATGNFPQEKPDGFSDELWQLHMSHHPEIYK